MDASARAELASIKTELNSIIRELEDISYGLRTKFTGIGNEQCAQCIDRVIGQYETVRRKLNTMDTSTVTESYAAAHSSGGGRNG